MNQKKGELLLEFFTWYREQGLAPELAFMEACEDYIFFYGTGEEPIGILNVSELKEVIPRNK